MSTIYNFINIPNQKGDLKTILELIQITNIGIEAIMYVYDDHRLDRNTSTKMFLLQENLIYRIYAVYHQYELLVEGLNNKSIVDLNKDPYHGDIEAHPIIYRYSYELSSIVDSIFFHLCSIFDYMAHFISYMFEANKDKTLDWGALAKKARATYKETLKSAKGINEIDLRIRIKLEWYRSQVIHRKRDLRFIGMTKNPKTNQIFLIFSTSPETMKHFKSIIQGYDSESKYTLDCLPSAVFYETLRSINYLLDFLRIDLISHSTFEENVKNPKSSEQQYLMHPVTKKIHPKSEIIWSDYRQQLNKFYLDLERRKNGDIG